MKLDTFIEKTGPKLLARKLRVDPSTVSNWRRRRSFPRPKKLMQIFVLSEGKVTYEEMIHHFVGARK